MLLKLMVRPFESQFIVAVILSFSFESQINVDAEITILLKEKTIVN